MKYEKQIRGCWKTVMHDDDEHSTYELSELHMAMISNTLGFNLYMIGYHIGNIIGKFEPMANAVSGFVNALIRGLKNG